MKLFKYTEINQLDSPEAMREAMKIMSQMYGTKGNPERILRWIEELRFTSTGKVYEEADELLPVT